MFTTTASAKIRAGLWYGHITNQPGTVDVGKGKRKSLKDFVQKVKIYREGWKIQILFHAI